MPSLHIALVQLRCEKGAIDANLAAHDAALRAAADRGVEIVCFPEASISGYVDPALYPRALLRLDGPEVARFIALTHGLGLTALAGIVEAHPDHPDEPGGKPYLTQVVARDGRLLGVYRKRTIPEDERHLFTPAGDAARVFTHAKAPFGVAICADIDNPAVFAECAALGARVIFEAAAPGLYGAQGARDWRSGYAWWRGECETKLGRYAREHGLFIAVATQAGSTSDEDFPGGGYVFGPDGALQAATPDWSVGTLDATLPFG
jgi:predicted amidohydrolase